MADYQTLLLGEFVRTIDDRYRLSLPAEFAEPLADESGNFLLAKERPGCLSLWSASRWQQKHQEDIELLWQKLRTGRLEGRLAEVQSVGRLLSTRQRPVQLAGRARLVVPEGFREFLGVEPGGAVAMVGAAICIEIWHPQKWNEHVGEQMPEFHTRFEQLIG
jgi:MraZ protein